MKSPPGPPHRRQASPSWAATAGIGSRDSAADNKVPGIKVFLTGIRSRLSTGSRLAASDRRATSVSFRTTTCRFAKAGCAQRTGRSSQRPEAPPCVCMFGVHQQRPVDLLVAVRREPGDDQFAGLVDDENTVLVLDQVGVPPPLERRHVPGGPEVLAGRRVRRRGTRRSRSARTSRRRPSPRCRASRPGAGDQSGRGWPPPRAGAPPAGRD